MHDLITFIIFCQGSYYCGWCKEGYIGTSQYGCKSADFCSSGENECHDNSTCVSTGPGFYKCQVSGHCVISEWQIPSKHKTLTQCVGMLVQRRRRWVNTAPALCQCLMFARFWSAGRDDFHCNKNDSVLNYYHLFFFWGLSL